MTVPPPPRAAPPDRPAAEELLAAARRVVNRPEAAWDGSWPRAAAHLTRQALEDAVRRLWGGPTAGLERATFTAQLVCLREYLGDPHLARRTHLTWSQLSQACHAHPYELAPTAGELRAWAELVQTLLDHVQRERRATGGPRRQATPGKGLEPGAGWESRRGV
jgi:cytochrome c5